MDILDFPFLNRDEFSAACHHLESRYCRATLGPLRKRWRLRLCTDLRGVFCVDGAYTTYIQIRRLLEPGLDLGHMHPALDLAAFSISDHGGQDTTVAADQSMLDAEESDKAAIINHVPHQEAEHVVYEIHLHPTYRVPCLWFALHNLPPDEPVFNIDTVFRRLVPDEYKDRLRGLGGIGGISADHHPITGVPCFFVHPCLLGDAISSFKCSRHDYLVIWLGLVGGCVGLWVPKEMALQ